MTWEFTESSPNKAMRLPKSGDSQAIDSYNGLLT